VGQTLSTDSEHKCTTLKSLKLFALERLCLCAFLVTAIPSLHADQVELQNGDHLVGKVLSLNTSQLVLQSDTLGTIKLPREKVAVVTLGTVTPAKVTPTPSQHEGIANPALNLNNSNQVAAAFRQLGANTNLIQQVQSQFLGDAGPEAVNKYNELLNGLMNGKISLDELRAQAKSAADQVRSLKGEMGDQTGILDTYLTILDKFVNETAPATPPKSSPNPPQPNSEDPP
jgi:hypothetical protein